MATRYVPEQYVDLATALLASSHGDTIVLDTSGFLTLTSMDFSSLNGITVRAAPGRYPVLDHSSLGPDQDGLLVGNGWFFRGVTFRDRNGRSNAIRVATSGHSIATIDCVFEGCRIAIAGSWSGVVTMCTFRHVSHVATTTQPGVSFTSSLLLMCRGIGSQGLVSLGPGSSIRNVTAFRCVTGDTVLHFGGSHLLADVVHGVTLSECRLLNPPGLGETVPVLVRGRVECSNNNAWSCVAPQLFATDPGGVLSGNTTVNPLHVAPPSDMRLRPDSPLIGAAIAAPTHDRHGMAYLTPPSVGAHESARLGVTVANGLGVISASVVGGIPDLEACLSPESWLVETDVGVRVTVREVVKVEGEDRFLLSVHPEMSTGVPYKVTLRPSLYGYDEASFTPSAPVPSYTLPEYRNVAVVMNAFGSELRELYGPIFAVLSYDVAPNATTWLVESTLDWEDSGVFWTPDGRRFSYSSKTDGALHRVAPVDSIPMLVGVPAGTRICMDDRSRPPVP